MIVTQNLNKVIIYAQEEAERLVSKRIEPDHLLLGILRLGEGSAFEVLQQTSIDVAAAKAHLEEQQRGNEEMIEPVQRSAQTDRILRIAEGISREYMAEAVGTIHLLLAILRERINTTASYLEREWHISFKQLTDIFGQPHYAPSETTQTSAEQTGDVNENNWQPQRGGQQPKNTKKGKTTALDKYGRDLTKLAEEGQLDPMVGREVEIERVVQILSRRKKNNPILIGEPGVGKSAIVEGLALRIVHNEAGALQGKRIITLDMASMVAGTTYRGQFEERMKQVITELQNHPEVILFVD